MSLWTQVTLGPSEEALAEIMQQQFSRPSAPCFHICALVFAAALGQSEQETPFVKTTPGEPGTTRSVTRIQAG